MARNDRDGKMNKYLLITLYLILVATPLAAVEKDAFSRRDWERLMNTGCCRNCRLFKAPLSRIDLTKADMRGSDLRGADFKQATLYKALLPQPELYQGADFSGAMWLDGRICKKGSIGHCRSE